jgi:hypothetical protein
MSEYKPKLDAGLIYFISIIGFCIGIYGFALLTCPLSTIPNKVQMESAKQRCDQLHGQLVFITERSGEPIKNINCITSTGYYSMYKSEDVFIWEQRYRHPKNGEIFD